MIILMEVIFWVFLVADLAYNLLVLLYAQCSMKNQEACNLERLGSLTGQVDAYEITGIKFGKTEIIKVIIAHLIEKGFLNVKEIIHERQREDYVNRWDGDYYRPSSAYHTTYSFSYEYRASGHRDSSELDPLEKTVLDALGSFKSAGKVASELGDFSVFLSYRQKMSDFGLVRLKLPIEEGIELFYNVNYVICVVALFALFLLPSSQPVWAVLILSAINSIAGFLLRYIFYAGRSHFEDIYPRAIPLPAYSRFIRLYEDTYCRVTGARPYRAILEGRR